MTCKWCERADCICGHVGRRGFVQCMCGEFIQIGHQHACPPVQRVKPAVADIITAPSHYIVGGYECREVIAALGLCFDIGAAFKYIWRAGRKDGADEVTDLRKAVECIEHRIRLLTGAGR